MLNILPDELESLKLFLQKKFNKIISDTDVKEIYTSLYYLGKAFVRYQQIQNEQRNINQGGR